MYQSPFIAEDIITAGYDDILFFILILVVTAIQGFAQYRKKKLLEEKQLRESEGAERKPSYDPMSEEKSESPFAPFFDKMEEYLDLDEPTDYPEERPYTVPVPVPEPQPKVSKVQASTKKNFELASDRPRQNNSKKVTNGTPMESPAKKKSRKRYNLRSITKDFDGRKAVIYSEIFNRKYQ